MSFLAHAEALMRTPEAPPPPVSGSLAGGAGASASGAVRSLPSAVVQYRAGGGAPAVTPQTPADRAPLQPVHRAAYSASAFYAGSGAAAAPPSATAWQADRAGSGGSAGMLSP
eukprot:156048-Chlamydomonas_euryale.AAC.1